MKKQSEKIFFGGKYHALAIRKGNSAVITAFVGKIKSKDIYETRISSLADYSPFILEMDLKKLYCSDFKETPALVYSLIEAFKDALKQIT
jgi:hypothetical protein